MLLFLFVSIFFIFSCQSDPVIGLNNLDNITLESNFFLLDQSLSKTIQGDAGTSESAILYSGIIETGDTVVALINLQSENLSSHNICTADSIATFNLVLNTFTFDSPINIDYLTITPFYGANLLEESSEVINNATSGTPLSNELINLSNNKIEIDLYNYDSSIINTICINKINIGLKISYIPIEEETEKIIEIYSSDITSTSVKPSINMDYYINELDTFLVNRYSIEQVFWSDNFSDPFFIEDSSNSEWGMVYLFDFIDINQIGDSFNYNTMQINSDIIINDLNTELELLQINVRTEYDSINFSIGNAIAFIGEIDPSKDNWSQINSTYTEGNGQLDWFDSNNNNKWDIGEGEEWYDYGLDNCIDELETGDIAAPCDSIENIYNPEGTEGNGQLDWIDTNGDGIWNLDEGEIWWDWGVDWCPDSLENGQGICEAEGSPCNCSIETTNTYDENNDNFDPVGDDFHNINNPAGKERNGIWEAGEPFNDWGSDGLPASILGDPDENEGDGNCNWIDNNNNGDWDPGEGEQWLDTGVDGKFNEDEVENYENRTEGDLLFNSGEKYLDCGIGENQFDSNYTCTDDGQDDNYNVDPNQDNYDIEDSSNDRSENNGQLDWSDNNNNNKWDINEGEQWFDWGIDGIPDSLEAFQSSQVIIPMLYDNLYQVDVNTLGLLPEPTLVQDTVSLWISDIENNGEFLSIKIKIRTNIELKGLQLQLQHTPFSMIDIIEKNHQESIIDYANNNLFNDITLDTLNLLSENELDSTLIVNYSDDLSTNLDFEGLSELLNNKEINISHEFSNLVFYIDKTLSQIHTDGMFLHLGYNNESNEYIRLNTYQVLSSTDSVVLSIGGILRGFQEEDYGDSPSLILKTDGNSYNYSRLIIKNDFEETGIGNNPHINLMYWE